MRRLALIVIQCMPILLYAQSYEEVASEVGIVYQYMGIEYGGGVSFYDVNKDGWDDITVATAGSSIRLYLNEGGAFGSPIFLTTNQYEAKSVVWVDYDNDGDADLFVTRYGGPWTLLKNNGNLLSMQDVTQSAGLPGNTSYLTYGQAWGDPDRDGDLDLYICNYNADGVTNFYYQNDGDGTFTERASSLGIDNGSVWSFQPAFIDYNHDMWPDLFVINDRLPASDNMYRNNGDGTWSDVTVGLGLDYYIFSMNNSCADYDHDGDLDIYVSNNPNGNLLHNYDKDSGTFTEIATDIGVQVNDHSWSAQWIDANNDGWEDLHVCCSPFWNEPGQNRFFYNNGDGTFTANYFNNGFEIDQGKSNSSASGDFNNDGFADLFVVQEWPDLSRMFECIPNDNHYVKIGLEGVVSNRDGIGAWLNVYANDMHLLRYTHCGEGYMTQNSQYEIFGLGEATTVDSLIVEWPSGHIDQFYDMPVDQLHLLTEGMSITAGVQAESNAFCEGDSLLLSLPFGLNVLWSNGETGNSIWVDAPGTYSFSAITQYGIPFNSEPFSVATQEAPSLTWIAEGPACNGGDDGLVAVGIPEGQELALTLDGDPVDPMIYGLSSGEYELIATNLIGCDASFEVVVPYTPSMEVIEDINHADCAGETGSFEFTVINGTPPYALDIEGQNPADLEAGDYVYTVFDTHGCQAEGAFNLIVPEPLVGSSTVTTSEGTASVDLAVEGGTPPYQVSWNGPGGFSSGEFNFETDAPGVYNAFILDANNCILTHAVVVESTVFVDEQNQPYWTVYPNPATDRLNVRLLDQDIEVIRLIDLSGRIIEDYPAIALDQLVQLDVSSLAPGVYVLKAFGANLTLTKRIVVER